MTTSYARRDTAYGPEAEAALRAFAAAQPPCDAGDDASDGPEERHVSDNEGDIAAGLYEDSLDRQWRWFER